MKFHPESSLEHQEGIHLRALPIPEVSVYIQKKIERKEWKNISITESVTNSPKTLEVIPNRIQVDGVMAWPAYYKTVKEGNENDGRQKGFGDLAEAIEGTIQNSPLVKVRPEIKSRLDVAQRMLNLNPETVHLQLVVVDGYRRADVQKKLFDAYLEFVRGNNKGLGEEEILNMVRKMLSEAPNDPEVLRKSPPPHSTGGAIDIVLVHKDRIDTSSDYWLQYAMVPFGAKFAEMLNPVYHDERSETVFYEKKFAEKGKLDGEDREGLENRRILYHTMTRVRLF